MQVVRWLTECGNGVVEGEEQCDDGNTEGGDGCSSVCKVLPSPVHPPCLCSFELTSVECFQTRADAYVSSVIVAERKAA